MADTAPTPGEATAATPPATGRRDVYVDFLRGFSLVVVVVWHWVFSIYYVGDGQFRATSVLQFSYALWPLTWVFQVMPLFFVVGGYVHRRTWHSIRARGGGYWSFVGGRAARLVVPSVALIAGWVVLGLLAVAYYGDRDLVLSAVVIVLSPLWFIAVYLLLVLIAPPMVALHDRFGPAVLVVLVGLAFVDDVLRFAHGAEWAAIANTLVVWAACHQLGFFWDRLVDGPRSWAAAFALGGGITLFGLIETGLYPASMVGVPGDQISNMAPPTVALLGVCGLQTGLAVLARPPLQRRLEAGGRWTRANELVNRFSMPLFLFHTTGMAIALYLLWKVFDYTPPATVDLDWWLSRFLVLAAGIAVTIPVILLFGRRWTRPAPSAGST